MSGQTTIVTVCYNSTAVLPAMLASLPAGVPVVLVDNASKDVDALRALAEAHGARLAENATNRGFGVGCNDGARLAETPYVLFLNPDTKMAPDCIAAFEAAAERYPQASAFNPRLLDGGGRDIFRRRTRLDPSFRLSGPPPTNDHEVPTLLGAAIFVRRAVFDRIGGFDADIFLYHEDDDLALRLRQEGPLMRIPQAVVTHQQGHGSVRSPQVAAFKAFHMARSKVHTYGKHGLALPRLRTLAEALANFVSPLMLSRRKRAKALGFLKGALSALKDRGKGFAEYR